MKHSNMSEAIVVDTNFLVRVFLSGNERRDVVFRKIRQLGLRLVYGREQFDELFEVLGYARITKNYNIDRDKLIRFRDWIIRKGMEVESETVSMCRDPDDNYILGLATSSSRDIKTYLLTSDKDILDLRGKIKNVRICTPGEFLKI